MILLEKIARGESTVQKLKLVRTRFTRLATSKNKNREKYGGIPKILPHYPGHKFTSYQPFNFKIAGITENYRNLVFGCYIFKSLSSV